MKRPIGLLIALTMTLVMLVLGEWTLARFLPFSDPFARFKSEDRGSAYVPSAHQPNYSIRIVAEEGLPGVEGSSVFSTNNVGFRGPQLTQPKPSGEYRIVMVGGSTTECMIIDDGVAPDRVLQDTLTAKLPGRTLRVYNAGKAGDKSYDHVALVAHRIVHLQPDMLVVFAGANDLRAAMQGADYLFLQQGTATKYTLSMLLKFAATEFQIPRRIHAVMHRIEGQTERELLEQVQMVTDYREKAALKNGRPVSDQVPSTNLPAYRDNLTTLIGIARTHGIQMVLVTQASTWNSTVDPKAVDWHWLTYIDGVLYREDLLDRALESYNDVMRTVGTGTDVPVFDLARDVPKSLEYFYDDAHFNVKGAAFFGKGLAEFILTRGLIRAADAPAITN